MATARGSKSSFDNNRDQNALSGGRKRDFRCFFAFFARTRFWAVFGLVFCLPRRRLRSPSLIVFKTPQSCPFRTKIICGFSAHDPGSTEKPNFSTRGPFEKRSEFLHSPRDFDPTPVKGSGRGGGARKSPKTVPDRAPWPKKTLGRTKTHTSGDGARPMGARRSVGAPGAGSTPAAGILFRRKVDAPKGRKVDAPKGRKVDAPKGRKSRSKWQVTLAHLMG